MGANANMYARDKTRGGREGGGGGNTPVRAHVGIFQIRLPQGEVIVDPRHQPLLVQQALVLRGAVRDILQQPPVRPGRSTARPSSRLLTLQKA